MKIHKLSSDDKTAVFSLLKEGVSQTDIAKKFTITKASVRYYSKQIIEPRKFIKWNSDLNRQLVDAFNKSQEVNILGKALDVKNKLNLHLCPKAITSRYYKIIKSRKF